MGTWIVAVLIFVVSFQRVSMEGDSIVMSLDIQNDREPECEFGQVAGTAVSDKFLGLNLASKKQRNVV